MKALGSEDTIGLVAIGAFVVGGLYLLWRYRQGLTAAQAIVRVQALVGGDLGGTWTAGANGSTWIVRGEHAGGTVLARVDAQGQVIMGLPTVT